jgi:hypothetical protein
MPRHATSGSFRPGASGNPKGRPPRGPLDENIVALARQRTPAAVEALTRALQSPRERVAAATVLLAYGYGRPSQNVSINGQLNAELIVGGIDAPPRCDSVESAEEWLARRRRELAELTGPTTKPPPIVDIVPEEPPQPEPPPAPVASETTTAQQITAAETRAPPALPRRPTGPVTWTPAQEAAWREQQQTERRGTEFGRSDSVADPRPPRRW